MSAANLQRIIQQVGKLSPQERLQLQAFLTTAPGETPGPNGIIYSMTAAVEKLIEQVKVLSAQERGELRAWMDSVAQPAADDAFAQKLVELGIGRPRPPGPRRPNPQPVCVEGKPLSQQLIEERR